MNALKSKITSLALGGFDGIHLGHQALVARLGDKSALLAIEHDRICLTPGVSRERFCAAPIFFVPLDELREMSPNAFIARLVSEFPALKRLVVGYDFRFGKDRAAGAAELKTLFANFGGECEIVEEVKVADVPVHAARIRLFLLDGNVRAAAKLLGRNHMIEGEIVRGQGLGAKRLYPTINLAVTRFLAPLDGVYASQTEVLGALYKSVSFVGQRLSADGAFAIESHIIDESFKDFAGKSEAEQPRSAAIFFAERLRENKRFDDLSNLKAQITNDIAAAKLLLE